LNLVGSCCPTRVRWCSAVGRTPRTISRSLNWMRLSSCPTTYMVLLRSPNSVGAKHPPSKFVHSTRHQNRMLRPYINVRMAPNLGRYPQSCRTSNPYPPGRPTPRVARQARPFGSVASTNGLSGMRPNWRPFGNTYLPIPLAGMRTRTIQLSRTDSQTPGSLTTDPRVARDHHPHHANHVVHSAIPQKHSRNATITKILQLGSRICTSCR